MVSSQGTVKGNFNQVGPPTIFWNLSCTEFHWPELHEMFGSPISENEFRKNVAEYPHIRDWFFHERTEKCIKHWLYNILGADWHWNRYEFTVLPNGMNTHGLAKLKSDPGLCKLSEKAAEGHKAKLKLQEGIIFNSNDELDKLNALIKERIKAEKETCNYYDYLISCSNPGNINVWVQPAKHPCRNSYETAVVDLDSDYIDIVNSVQRYSKCNSAYSLREDKQRNQYCRFHYPFDINQETYISYTEMPNKGEKHFKAEVVAQRNDPRVNRHQRIQLHGWRANCDIQLVIDHHACVEYLAKYAAKAEKLSSIAKDAFENVISHVADDSSPQSAIQKIFIKSVGERDMGIQEVMHQIISLKLYSSSFSVHTISLDNSKKCEVSKESVKFEKSQIESYAERILFGKHLTSCKLVDFLSKYQIKNGKLITKKKQTIIRTVPSYSSNPDSNSYDLYCKYQLLKYKPWQSGPNSVWDFEDGDDMLYVRKWREFLESDYGKLIISN